MNFDHVHLKALEQQIAGQKQTGRVSAAVSLLRILMAVFLILLAAGITAGTGYAIHVISGAPDAGSRKSEQEAVPSVLYDSAGNPVLEISGSQHDPASLAYAQIPQDLIKAFLAAEDNRFWYHHGIDLRRIVRAAYVAATTGKIRSGTDTVTQLLVRNNILNPVGNKSLSARIRSAIEAGYVAVSLEKKTSKEAILREYLSTISLGNGCRGVHEAAEYYFGKPVQDLTLAECTAIAAAASDPVRCNPLNHPEANQEARLALLEEMKRLGYISGEAMEEAKSVQVYSGIMRVSDRSGELDRNWFAEAACRAVARDLTERLGMTPTQAEDLLAGGGLRIDSTMDAGIQTAVEEECSDPSNFYSSAGTRFSEYALKYRLTVLHSDGTTESFNENDVTEYHQTELEKPAFKNIFRTIRDMRQAVWDFKAAKIREDDTVREELFRYIPQPQVSVVIMDPETGAVLAVTGAREMIQDGVSYNRALDDLCQPGSSFMIPAVFAPAIDIGNATLASVFYDAPYQAGEQQIMNWWGNQYLGYNNIRQAIKYSMNVIAMKCMQSLVSPESAAEYAEKMGISTLKDEDRRPQIALGSLVQGVYNLEMAAAYAAIASGGVYHEPVFYTKVTDREGNVLLENTAQGTRVMKKTTAALLTLALGDAMSDTGIYSQYGILPTGSTAKAEGIPAAGKPGSGADSRDVWFTGYSSEYVCSVWAGYDAERVLGTGQVFHKQLWKKIMKRIHGEEPKELSDGTELEYYTICSKSGLLAIDGVCNYEGSNSVTYQEAFAPGTQPAEYCDRHYPIWICRESGQAAGENCPRELWEQHVYFRIPDAELAAGATLDSSYLAPAALTSCTVHAGAEESTQSMQP